MQSPPMKRRITLRMGKMLEARTAPGGTKRQKKRCLPLRTSRRFVRCRINAIVCKGRGEKRSKFLAKMKKFLNSKSWKYSWKFLLEIQLKISVSKVKHFYPSFFFLKQKWTPSCESLFVNIACASDLWVYQKCKSSLSAFAIIKVTNYLKLFQFIALKSM